MRTHAETHDSVCYDEDPSTPHVHRGRRHKERVERRTDKATREALDAVKCLATDKACIESAEGRAGRSRARPHRERESAAPAAASDPGGAGGTPAAASLKPGEGARANYDFVPGERILQAEDVSGDRVGNFPKRFEFRSGNMQIVEWQDARWLSAEDGKFVVTLPETPPERFTLEFDLAGHGNAMRIGFSGDEDLPEPYLEIGTYDARFRNGKVDAQGEFRSGNTQEKPLRIRIAVDGDYLKLYADEFRALNVPNARPGRSTQLVVDMNGWSAEDPRMIADVRLGAGGREMYDALMRTAAWLRRASCSTLAAIGSARSPRRR